jgi:hypothetical protein
VHVHLEWLPGQQLDPVHAVVGAVPAARTLHALREAKIAALTAQYRAWRAAGGGRGCYRRFLARCPWLAAMGVSDFGRWVQWRLWQQLADAYAQVVNLGGVQLMIDVVAEPAGDWAARLIAASRCAQIVRVVRLESVLFAPLDPEAVRQAFPPGAGADLFLGHFCAVGDGHVHLKSWIVDPARVRAVLARFAPADAHAQSAALTRLMHQAMAGPMRSVHAAAGDAGAAIVLEARIADFCRMLGRQGVVWEGLGMIPATDDARAAAPAFLMPRRLSPEMISEFPEDATPQQIREHIKHRAGSPAQAVTVYLHDLLVAEAGMQRVTPQSLEEIEGYCRFTFPFTIEELRANQEITSRVQALVESSHRAF